MAYDKKSLDDYVDVATRIADFREQYPEGSLRPVDPSQPFEVKQVQGFDNGGDVVTQTFVVVVAAAYRREGDEAPGIGMAWEVFPGRTPYTRGSELQNAETSAWGRAIIAALASDSKAGVASRDEVRNRQADQDEVSERIARAMRNAPPEVDEHGAATEAEQTRMRRGREPGTQRLSAVPANDQFYDSAGPPLEPAEGVPGSVTPGQLQKIGIRMTAAGITDRGKRLRLVADITGRPVTSSKELSFSEAAKVIKDLESRAPVSSGPLADDKAPGRRAGGPDSTPAQMIAADEQAADG